MANDRKVYLVGAGPGDPGLITVKGAALISRADVVVYDFLANRRLLSRMKEGAEAVCVGKRAGKHTKTQEETNQLLVDLWQEGKEVVRLKGGDPFVFGRGGEEAEALTEAGIPYEVIPGVTAALGAGGYAEIPLTVRGITSSVTLVTGHEDPTKEESDIDWAALARTRSTLVIYMAMAHLEEVAARLIAGGLPPETPAALVGRATMPDQVSLTATLKDLPGIVRERDLKPPSVVIIGKVVDLETGPGWFERLPLIGRRLVVTAVSQDDPLIRGLNDLGARVFRITGPDAADFPTRRAVDAIARQQASILVFTRPSDPDGLLKRVPASALEIPVAALGAETARIATDLGFAVHVEAADVAGVLAGIRELCVQAGSPESPPIWSERCASDTSHINATPSQ